MEEAEVIDIDDLLGSSSSVEQEDLEEYDFENFPIEDETLLEPRPSSVTLEKEASAAVHDGIHQRNKHAENCRPRNLSSANDFQKLLLSASSAKSKSQNLGSVENSNNNSPWEKDEAQVRVMQNEALLDAFIQEELQDSTPSADQLSIDVNSEELRQFILEFESRHNGSQGNIPDVLTPSGENANQELAAKHGRFQSEDQDSLNSSISTSESRDSSLTSSFASSDLSPVRTKQKVPRGKSVRFLMSSLLRNHRATQQHPPSGRASGSEEDTRHSKRPLIKSKDRNKKRYKEGKAKDKVSNELFHKSQQPNPPALSHAKNTSQSTCAQDQLQLKAHSRIQSSKPLVATPLSPGENTLHKQLMQAATRGDQQVLEFLLTANERLSEVRDDRGNNLLHIVTRRGHVDCLAWLATGPCASLLSVENDDGFTPAALAVKHGQLDCIRWLIEHSEASRSELKSHDQLESHDHCWYSLHLAARFGQEPCLRWLLEHMQMQGISLDQTDLSNNSPAHLASKYGHLRCIQTLVEFNCDVTSPNKKQQTPYTLATKYCHDACAQFLVVVETSIRLSNELALAQKQLRGSQQENGELTKKLREALSCTDALVHMQKTDLSQRIDHLQEEYVDLVNLLVRQLDYLQGQTRVQTVPHVSREDVLVSQQKANQLKNACSELLELEKQRQRDPTDQDRLKEIERRLSRLQPVPTGHIWSKPVSTKHGSSLPVPLDAMRARLSEVSHENSSLRHPTLSHTSENLDTLSLTTSSCMSSISSSSITGGTSQTSLGHSTNKPQVPLNHKLPQLSTISTTDRSKIVQALSEQLEIGIRKSPISDCSFQNHTSSNISEFQGNTDVQYSDRSMRPHVSGIVHAQSSTKHLKSAIPCDSESDPDLEAIGKGSKELEQSFKKVARKSGTSPPSYKETCAKHSMCSLGGKSSTSPKDTSERKARCVAGKLEEQLECRNQIDLKSQCVLGLASNKESGNLEAYILPSFDKPQQKGDIDHQVSSKHYALTQKHSQQAIPGFMRKVQPTNEFGEPESGNIVKISTQEEMVVHTSVTSSGSREKSSHQRADSNSSMSSQSSDLPGLGSDPEDSSLSIRAQRGGILAKKNGDGSKRSQDRHITFALDSDEKPSATSHPLGKKPLPSKLRGLSPISEAPDLVKSTNNDVKGLLRDGQRIENKDAKGNVSQSLSEEHNEQQKVNNVLEKSLQSSLEYPEDLSDIVSREFTGVGENDNDIRTDKDDAEKLWYESSEDENDGDEVDSVHIPARGGLERHVCYL